MTKKNPFKSCIKANKGMAIKLIKSRDFYMQKYKS